MACFSLIADGSRRNGADLFPISVCFFNWFVNMPENVLLAVPTLLSKAGKGMAKTISWVLKDNFGIII
jgi:hypothetical protein